MSTLIEQASLRLEQLRRAGASVAPADVVAAPVGVVAEPVAKPQPLPKPASPAVPPAAEFDPGATMGQLSRRVEFDLDALAAAGIVSPNAPRSKIADQYRVIKRPLIANAMAKGASVVANGNLIMVTSAVAGEGKSFTALNLAMSIATELDNTVMLVDADVARPSILRMLGLPASQGLLDLLIGDVPDLSRVMLRTNIDKLTILPSGTPHARATELLASDSMSRLIEDMAKRYSDRIIIFDSPPLLLTTESRVLATHMGQIVVVVHADKTLQSDLQHAVSTIEACPVKMVVLNQARAGTRGGYGYGYGEGYGYGYGQ